MFEGTAVPQGIGPAIVGAEICIYDHPELPCDTTDSQGQFTVFPPANAETALTLAANGFGGVLVALVTSDQPMYGWVIGMPPLARITSFYETAGTPYPDPGKGFVQIYAMTGNGQQGLAGVSMTLAPAGGVGPLYADAAGDPDGTLQATTTAGFARYGALPLGTLEVGLLPDTLACQPNFGGWVSPNLNAVRAPVAEGFETHLGFYCQ
ncbi:MAG: DUF4244 domain-containing protein [Polyangiaceae bacterium]|nr:DUF4244 domain-containing protein [Polyangiaceae bacterium]